MCTVALFHQFPIEKCLFSGVGCLVKFVSKTPNKDACFAATVAGKLLIIYTNRQVFG